jgi:hypothetical protein
MYLLGIGNKPDWAITHLGCALCGIFWCDRSNTVVLARLSAIDSLPDRVLLRLASYSRNTQRALRADWRVFAAWCADPLRHADNTARRAFPLTPGILVEFIHACSLPIVRHRDGTLEVDSKAARQCIRSASTISRYLTSLRILHRFAEWPGGPTKDVDVQATRRIVMRGRLWSQPRAPLRLEYVTRILKLKGKSLPRTVPRHSPFGAQRPIRRGAGAALSFRCLQ